MSIEDIEEIRRVRSKYYMAVDARRWDEAVDIYSDQASVDFAGVWKGQTKKGIKKVLLDMVGAGTSATFHCAYLPIVEVDGDTATAVGYLEIHSLPVGSEETISQIGRIEDQYIKEKGKWKLKRAVYTTLVQSKATGQLIQKKSP
jgi:ketosteroid isomerase-like protein